MESLQTILKARWPEAVLIVVFQAVSIILAEKIAWTFWPDAGNTLSEMAIMALAAGSACFGVLWLILLLGFLRSARVMGAAPHDPHQLIIIGRHFFWRTVLIKIVTVCLTVILLFTLLPLTHLIFSSMGTPITPENQPAWPHILVICIAHIILVKLIIVTPAFIVSKDCSVTQALEFTSQSKLIEGARLLMLFGAWLALITAYFFLRNRSDTEMQNLMIAAIYAVLKSALTLLIYLRAIKFSLR